MVSTDRKANAVQMYISSSEMERLTTQPTYTNGNCIYLSCRQDSNQLLNILTEECLERVIFLCGQETALLPPSDVAARLLETVAWDDVVKAFSQGFNGGMPSPDTLRMANQLIKAATKGTIESEFYVDDSDGALGFMLRLNNGLLLMAELSVTGMLSGGTYDDSDSGGKQVKFIDNVTVNQMLELF